MSVTIDQWRANIGLFYGQVYGHLSIELSFNWFYIMLFLQFLFFYFF